MVGMCMALRVYFVFFFFLMIRRPPRSTHCISSAASDVYKRQISTTDLICTNIGRLREKQFPNRSFSFRGNTEPKLLGVSPHSLQRSQRVLPVYKGLKQQDLALFN
eukprot:TRINITY_DN18379_c0_g1_i1.p2 TRINITY_DN18379_c0_g1~~TRINITY_DN18379_c0_g1_i1.p2  ORF type:complete len:106 (-),score=6.30 TRINITY_DN18379_c0_g1_i1:113-430(-)